MRLSWFLFTVIFPLTLCHGFGANTPMKCFHRIWTWQYPTHTKIFSSFCSSTTALAVFKLHWWITAILVEIFWYHSIVTWWVIVRYPGDRRHCQTRLASSNSLWLILHTSVWCIKKNLLAAGCSYIAWNSFLYKYVSKRWFRALSVSMCWICQRRRRWQQCCMFGVRTDQVGLSQKPRIDLIRDVLPVCTMSIHSFLLIWPEVFGELELKLVDAIRALSTSHLNDRSLTVKQPSQFCIILVRGRGTHFFYFLLILKR